MMVDHYAKIAGLVLFLVGVLGGIPAFAPHGMLFGIFRVDSFHNLFHLISGLTLVAVGFSENWELSRRVVLMIAAIYGLLTVVGFLAPQGTVLGMHMNMADNVLHLTITAMSLVFALPVQRYPMRH